MEKDSTQPENGIYQTGTMRRRKDHKAGIAAALAAVIVLCGVFTALGLMKIRLFRQSQSESAVQSLCFSAKKATDAPDDAQPESYARLGFSGKMITPLHRQYADLPEGVYITAAKGGKLRAGDVLVRFQGAYVTDARALHRQLAACADGTLAELVLYRKGELITVSLPVGE